MKIFDEKNRKIYVQICDVLHLYKRNYYVLSSIKEKVHLDYNNDVDIYSFLEFSNNDEIEYFRSLNFILNYNDYSQLNKEELKDKIILLSKDIEISKNKVNNVLINSDNNIETDILVNEIINKEYFLSSLNELLFRKKNNMKFDIPIINKNNEETYKEDKYIMCSTMIDNVFYIFKEDNSMMNENDIIPSGFCIRGLKYLLNDENENYIYRNKMSEDNKKLIVTLVLEKENIKPKIFQKLFSRG